MTTRDNWILDAGRSAMEQQGHKIKADIQAGNFQPDMKDIFNEFVNLIMLKTNEPQTFAEMVQQVTGKVNNCLSDEETKEMLRQIISLVHKGYELNALQSKSTIRSEQYQPREAAIAGSGYMTPSFTPSVSTNIEELPKDEVLNVTTDVQTWMNNAHSHDVTDTNTDLIEESQSTSTIDRTHQIKNVGSQDSWDECMLRFRSEHRTPPMKVCSVMADDCSFLVAIDITMHPALPNMYKSACQPGDSAHADDDIMSNDWLVKCGDDHFRVRPLTDHQNGQFEVLFVDNSKRNEIIDRSRLVHPANSLQFIAFTQLKFAIKLPSLKMTPGLEYQARSRFKQYITGAFFNVPTDSVTQFETSTAIGPFADVVLTDLTFIIENQPGFPQYKLGSLSTLLQRSIAFNGDETALFHEMLAEQAPVKRIELAKGDRLTVLALPTNDIWCEDENIFIQCCKKATNDSAELAAFNAKLTNHYKKGAKHIINREYKKEWLHEGQVVVCPWMTFNETDLYRGVICGIDSELQTASISHLDYYSIDVECPLGEIQALETGGNISKFRNPMWNAFIIRLPIEQFEDNRKDEIRAEFTDFIKNNGDAYGDPLPTEIVILGKDESKENVYIGDIVTSKPKDNSSQHYTLCFPEEKSISAEDEVKEDEVLIDEYNLTIDSQMGQVPDLEAVPYLDAIHSPPDKIPLTTVEELGEAIADQSEDSLDTLQVVLNQPNDISDELDDLSNEDNADSPTSPLTVPLDSYEMLQPSAVPIIDINTDSGDTESDAPSDYETSTSSSSQSEDVIEDISEPENAFEWNVMNGTIDMFKKLVPETSDQVDPCLIGKIFEVKDGKVIFHATHTSNFEPLNTTELTSRMEKGKLKSYLGEVRVGDWFIHDMDSTYRARIVEDADQKCFVYKFDVSNKPEEFATLESIRTTYPKIYYPDEIDDCFTFVLAITDEVDLSVEEMERIDQCLPYSLVNLTYFKVTLSNTNSAKVKLNQLDPNIFPDEIDVIPACVMPYIPDSVDRYDNDLTTIIKADGFYGLINEGWEKIGNDFNIPMHSQGFWPTLAMMSKAECKESVQDGYLCLPMDIFCFGIRVDDLQYKFHTNWDTVQTNEVLLHSGKFVLHNADHECHRYYIDTIETTEKMDIVDIDTGIKRQIGSNEAFVYPNSASKDTTTVICSLAVLPTEQQFSNFGHLLNTDDQPLSRIKFKIIGFDPEFVRYYVDIAYLDPVSKLYKSYTSHLIEKNMAQMIEGLELDQIDFDKLNESVKGEYVEENTITPDNAMSDQMTNASEISSIDPSSAVVHSPTVGLDGSGDSLDIAPLKGVSVTLKSFNMIPSGDEEETAFACLWIPRKSDKHEFTEVEKVQMKNVAYYKKISNGQYCNPTTTPIDGTKNLAYQSTETIGEKKVCYRVSAVNAAEGLYLHKDRKDRGEVKVEPGQIFELDSEVPNFQNVDAVLTDRKVNQFLKAKVCTIKQVESIWKNLEPKLLNGQVKIFFKRGNKDTDGGPFKGIINVKGKPKDLGLSDSPDPDSTMSMDLYQFIHSKK